PAARAATLAARTGRPAAAALGALLTRLVDLVGEARRDGRWAADQAWRFAAAGVLAEAEALLAAVELIDPECRAVAGLPGRAAARDEAALGYALGWRGADLAARVQVLAADLRVDRPADTAPGHRDLVGAFAGELAPARAALRHWLTSPPAERAATDAVAGPSTPDVPDGDGVPGRSATADRLSAGMR
ncbi:hypothetical protein ABZU53_23515, partial [Micromonospora sp. NPDC005194]